MTKPNQPIVDLRGLSQQLGLSKRWLQSEAVAGRVPSFKAGGRRVFNIDAVRRYLAERASPYHPDSQPWIDPDCLEEHVSSEQELCRQCPDDPDQHRWLVSIHEAGHAVVALRYGLEVTSVHLNPDGGGECRSSRGDGFAVAVMAAAGPLAQKIFASESKPERATVDLGTLDQSWKRRSENADLDRVLQKLVISDEQRLRAHVIEGGRRNPNLWAKRLYEIDCDARIELERNKVGLINMASALYLEGQLRGDDVALSMDWPGGVRPSESSSTPQDSGEGAQH